MKRGTKAMLWTAGAAALVEFGVPALFIARLELERWSSRRLQP